MNTTKNQRQRYSPEVRREMILDNASHIIVNEGVASLSMERISREAGISKSLMYRYFESLIDLMRELLTRELKALRKAQFSGAKRAKTFEQLVRNVTHAYISYIDKRGMIIEKLLAEPSLSDANDPTDYDRSVAVDYLAKILSRNFDIPFEVAQAATDISFGLPASAGEYLLRGELSREQVEDLTVSMIIGSFNAVRNDFMMKHQPLKQ